MVEELPKVVEEGSVVTVGSAVVFIAVGLEVVFMTVGSAVVFMAVGSAVVFMGVAEVAGVLKAHE